MSMLVSFVLSFFPRDVLDEILNLIGSVSEGFPSYSLIKQHIKNYRFTFSIVCLFLDSYCYFQLINFVYPDNVNHTILLQSKYWLSANIHVSFDT